MMSKKCKYALKALIFLAKNQDKGNLFTADIATQENIPKKFLEQILLVLKRAGYVGSQTGYGGGYFLLKPAPSITVADIHRLFDGAIALVPCVAVDYYQKCADCNDEVTCTMRREFMKIKEQTRLVMKETSIASFLEE
ncbi:Rrf2 family transcriptional regulator [Flavobacterium sp. MFBS3-15]|uniref:RrF2 family transcriptional regulator n=1 Tax=Flavobacterium sp. MFBS3-15 TaxID=2989816 RepID=UPI0022365575|nr:Rrf2 family transcriptional regulator [Flavobacterium sp. MFBS3-15]MCW4470061.1 Rrf2 family transcriptional regulator [Flavobacterium sp. MFBS3-15]